MRKIRAYFNQMAASWDEASLTVSTVKLERMAKRLKIRPGFSVLDVGTGTGVFLPFLLKEVGQAGRIIASDVAEEMLRKARAKPLDGNIDYLQADVASSPLRDEVFDVIVCDSSFAHFQDKPGALSEMRRVLKNSGRLFICHTSSRDRINDIHRRVRLLNNDIIPDDDEMRSMLAAAGFAEIAVEDSGDSYLASAEKPGGIR